MTGADDISAALGKVGLPAPLAELAAREWDAIVVGGGHNGLTAAAYLARAGRSVLVLERRERLGGACTLEQPFADPRYLVSPCAYVVGLLDQVVVDELELERHGYRVFVGRPAALVPVRRRHLVRRVPRPRPHRGPPARQRLLRGRHRGPVRLRGPLRPSAPALRTGPQRRHAGWATRPSATSSRSSSATTAS